MPDSPVFPGDFSVQENQDISQPSRPFPCCRPRQGLVAPRTQPPALAACPRSCQPARQQGREMDKLEHTHTRLSNVQDLAEDQGELDAASSERAFVFVFPAAVLEDKLEERAVAWRYMGHGVGGLP